MAKTIDHRNAAGGNCRRILAIACALRLLGISTSASQATKKYGEAGANLNAAYRTLIAKIQDPEERTLLVQAQKAWIKFRDDNLVFFSVRYSGSKGVVSRRLTLKRAAFLRSLLAAPPAEDPGGPE